MTYRRLTRRQALIRFDDDTDYADEQQIVFNPEVPPSFEPVDTGLVDPEGYPIVRDDSAPLGFLQFDQDD
jgi:hypothetical protein